MRRSGLAFWCGIMLTVACSQKGRQAGQAYLTMEVMNRAAEDYVKLVLAMGPHDADYVDAYYGPPSLKAAAGADLTDLGSIRQKAEGVLGELREVDASNEEELVRLRHRFLLLQLQSLLAPPNMLA